MDGYQESLRDLCVRGRNSSLLLLRQRRQIVRERALGKHTREGDNLQERKINRRESERDSLPAPALLPTPP